MHAGQRIGKVTMLLLSGRPPGICRSYLTTSRRPTVSFWAQVVLRNGILYAEHGHPRMRCNCQTEICHC